MPDRRPLDPTKSCWALYARRMCRERAKAGLKQDEVAQHCTVSVQLYGHYENCRRVPTIDVSRKLDGLYDLDEYFEELHPLVIGELELPPDFLQYTEEEARASAIRMYHPLFAPGLVQNEAYAREILRAGEHADKLEHLVAARMSRQEILTGDDPPWLFLLLSEHAIRNPVGGPEVMKEQITRLLELNEQPRFSVQMVPDGAPVYPSGAFTLLDFPEGGELGYVEAAGGNGGLIMIPERVKRLAVLWEQIRNVALPAHESEKLIRRVLESM